MLQLAEEALRVCNIFATRIAQGHTLNEFESQLYEASARLGTTILRFQDSVSQSAVIQAERELDELHEEQRTC